MKSIRFEPYTKITVAYGADNYVCGMWVQDGKNRGTGFTDNRYQRRTVKRITYIVGTKIKYRYNGH